MSAVSSEYAHVLKQVQNLPVEERVYLADAIIKSLEAERSFTNGEWSSSKNARRCELIDKDRRRVAPIPMEGAKELHRQLLRKRRLRLGSYFELRRRGELPSTY